MLKLTSYIIKNISLIMENMKIDPLHVYFEIYITIKRLAFFFAIDRIIIYILNLIFSKFR